MIHRSQLPSRAEAGSVLFLVGLLAVALSSSIPPRPSPPPIHIAMEDPPAAEALEPIPAIRRGPDESADCPTGRCPVPGNGQAGAIDCGPRGCPPSQRLLPGFRPFSR